MAQIFLSFLAIYFAVGLVFAVLFALSGYKSIDAQAATARLRIRILWMPAAVALWPLLLRIWVRSHSSESKPEETAAGEIE